MFLVVMSHCQEKMLHFSLCKIWFCIFWVGDICIMYYAFIFLIFPRCQSPICWSTRSNGFPRSCKLGQHDSQSVWICSFLWLFVKVTFHFKMFYLVKVFCLRFPFRCSISTSITLWMHSLQWDICSRMTSLSNVNSQRWGSPDVCSCCVVRMICCCWHVF